MRARRGPVVRRSPAALQPRWLCNRFAIPFSAMSAAIFNLNGHATYVHWHFIDLSVPNIVVLVLMVIVFVAAILLPFPKHGVGGSDS
jgi:hypothetical protein